MFAQQAVKGRETLSKTDSLAMIPVMTEDELENVMENFANEDAYYDKTFTRVVVENFFGKVKEKTSDVSS